MPFRRRAPSLLIRIAAPARCIRYGTTARRHLETAARYVLWCRRRRLPRCAPSCRSRHARGRRARCQTRPGATRSAPETARRACRSREKGRPAHSRPAGYRRSMPAGALPWHAARGGPRDELRARSSYARSALSPSSSTNVISKFTWYSTIFPPSTFTACSFTHARRICRSDFVARFTPC